MAQRSLIKEYEPRRFSYGAFGFIDSVVVPPLREMAIANRQLFSTGCPLKQNIRHNGELWRAKNDTKVVKKRIRAKTF